MRTLAVCFLTAALGLFAQSDRGTITGTVSDPAGAVVAAAAVEARNTETGGVYQTSASTTGNYTLAELPAGTRVVVVGEVDGAADEIAFDTKTNATITWAHRNGAAAGESDVLAKTLSRMKLPGGDYYAWVACESLTAKALRRQLIAEHGANPKWTRAAGYWRRGVVAVHEVHDN